MTVVHTVFGQGTVTKQDSKTVTVNFNGIGKTMVIKFANLLNEDGSVFTATIVKKERAVKATYPTPVEYSDTRDNLELLSDVLKNKRNGEWA